MFDLSKYKRHSPTFKPNLLKIPVNNFEFNEADIEEFNKIYKYCYNNPNLGELVLTKSGGICIQRHILRGPRYVIRRTNSVVEIILRDEDGYYYRFMIGHTKDKKSGMFGRAAFAKYKKTLEDFGVNLEDYAIENGKEVKETIPAPKIDLERAIPGRTYINANHLDINSAYNAGMIKAFPVLEPAVKYMYAMRKIDTDYKNVLNMTQGFMQSKLIGYKYAHISKAGYDYTLKTIEDLAAKMTAQGLRVLAYNTDGIWYDGGIYHDENEGTSIGQWKNDHLNCQLRFKSKGCYEFIENGVYKPVFRGVSTYEAFKARKDWEWGDIFMGNEKTFSLLEGTGIIVTEGDLYETI